MTSRTHSVEKETTWAIVPVKRLTEAKSRLAPVLTANARSALQQAMFADVLAALQRSKQLDGVMVVTADTLVARMACQSGASVAEEPVGCGGLNAAVHEGVSSVRREGATYALVVPADIPLIDSSEIDELVGLGRRRQATFVVPSHDLIGTNGLLFRLDKTPEFAFGDQSFRRHMQAQQGCAAVQASLASFARDVDTPDDLTEVVALLRSRTSPSVMSRTAAWVLAHVHCHEGCPG